MNTYALYRTTGPECEHGFYIESARPLSEGELEKLVRLIGETYDAPGTTSSSPRLTSPVVEKGPRLVIESPFSSTAVSICQSSGLASITRFEKTRRFGTLPGGMPVETLRHQFDRMTEQLYENGITSFAHDILPAPVRTIPLLEGGIAVLEQENKALGLGMDKDDLAYYFELFTKSWGRDPTDVELFQLGNMNSEHSRHWFFRSKIEIDGKPMPFTLFELVKWPIEHRGTKGCLTYFRDNAGVIEGFDTLAFLPEHPGLPSRFRLAKKTVHLTATAETHNHPTFVAPFPGAETGVGGRIRDTSAVGRGGVTGFGLAGYATGNLFIPGHHIPGEEVGANQPSQYASPLQIAIDGSNGVSSYGNKIGEPNAGGYFRSFGQMVDGEWREWRKPILYSAGCGTVFDEHVEKRAPEKGMLLVHLGGPAYAIGVGGGSASSMVSGENAEHLDYNSVQRGNPEMENRVNRVIRTCVELGPGNPIRSIHDQGASGLSNVFTELMEPLGGHVDIRKMPLGDSSMSVLQIWSAEFQEGYGLLVDPSRMDEFRAICERERATCSVLGEITGDGNVVVEDSETGTTVVHFNLEQVLSRLPQKTFSSTRRQKRLLPLSLPEVTLEEAIRAVFALPSVCSKGFLVHKVDRSVGGLIAQQQTCGIEQIPVADASVAALSYFDVVGHASAIGEQPVKGLVSAAAGARMSVGEMLTNLAGVHIGERRNIFTRMNWMWAGKLPGEGAELYEAMGAAVGLHIALGIAPHGGKDSLSMAAHVGGTQVKAPGSLVVIGHAAVPDIRKKVTPDVKRPGDSFLCLIDLGCGKNRLGGSALAQAYGQLGNESPDVDDPPLLARAFDLVQDLIRDGLVLALHDRSEGGLITTVAEMCMASNCGFSVTVPTGSEPMPFLFNEELGWVVEVASRKLSEVTLRFLTAEVPFACLGYTDDPPQCEIRTAETEVLWKGSCSELRAWWEATSFALEKLQCDPDCIEEESKSIRHKHSKQTGPVERSSYHLTFVPEATRLREGAFRPPVAILREEGTNGDREMAAAFYAGGCDPVDVMMSDLLAGRVSLDEFRGLAFCGGFSYMDTLGSGKGWAASILWNDKLREMFDRFYEREDTFSLGVCNGCQVMALLGWVPVRGLPGAAQPRFIENRSDRFDVRFPHVTIRKSPAILLRGMEGSTLGVWTAHAEGRLFYPDPGLATLVREEHLTPLAYVDPDGRVTEQYPYNPNGSPLGETALCTLDGRHLAMMPHPERLFRLEQWPWLPPDWQKLDASPWLRMFQNARTWCLEHR